MPTVTAHRGAIFHFREDADTANAQTAYEHFEDGILLVEDGRVAGTGPAGAMLERLPEGAPVVDHGRRIIMPGFIDAHCHAPQTGAMASYGEQLLEWLQDYIFPAEAAFADPEHARRAYRFFLDELLRNGTTTAMAYSTSHASAADILFEEALGRSMRFITGKTMMDRNAPDNILDTARSGYEESRALMEKWHGRGRLGYAVTPRFAPTSTPEQLEAAGRLLAEVPGLRMQTHLSENRDELDWVKRLFPQARDYLDVYDRFGLLGPGSVFGHCIHLSDRELDRMAGTGSVACWCPTSNLFLGSGMFDLARARRHGVRVAIATDVGAGTSLSMLATLGEAYKTAAAFGTSLSPFEAFHMITLGNARALNLDGFIGNFSPGREADFVVLDPAATPILAHRAGRASSLSDTLFALMMLGDDRAVAATYVAGQLASTSQEGQHRCV
ncbi:MAG: guanine deaminase [Thermodesulfobacteriota bacterium]